MRISPHDIRHQQFTIRMFRGFDPHEVDTFLEAVADDYETLLKESQLLKEQLAAQQDRLRGVHDLERTLQDTLVTTQRLADEVKAAARRESDLRGEKAVEAARAQEARIRADIQALKRIRGQLVGDLGATLERYQRLLGVDGEGVELE